MTLKNKQEKIIFVNYGYERYSGYFNLINE